MGIESSRGLAMWRSVTQLGEQYVSWDARLAPPVPAQGDHFCRKQRIWTGLSLDPTGGRLKTVKIGRP